MFAILLFLYPLVACGSLPGSQSNPPHAPVGSWEGADVGEPGVPGFIEGVFGDTQLRIHGAGDIWGSTDSFHYYHSAINGDATITSRITLVEHVNDWTKAGLMFRESDSPTSPYVLVFLSPENGSVMQIRPTGGAASEEVGREVTVRPPTWLRVSRVGDVFSGSYSADGKEWTQIGSATIAMADDALVGLVVSSWDANQLATAAFSGSSLELEAAPAGPSPTPEPGPAPEPQPKPSPNPHTTILSFTADTSIFQNPERGFYVEGSPQGKYDQGYTLLMRFVRLDEYVDQPLPTSFLEGLAADFANVRKTGVKYVLRFSYNRSRAPDAPINVVQEHIIQLAPILHTYADVIAAVEAGFIGAWGEWHSSTNNLTTLENRAKVLNGLLGSLPSNRMVGVRTPGHARDIYPAPPTQTSAFDGSNASRVGQHNDCFLSTSNDAGTYFSEADRDYAESISEFTVMGGETCDLGGLNERNDCPNALLEMRRYHWDYLNASFWSPILDRWRDEGCFDQIARNLGYRFVLDTVLAPTITSPGSSFEMTIIMSNTGFGKLYNPRPLQLVFVPHFAGDVVTVTLSEDARMVLPGPEETTIIDTKAYLPDEMVHGTYDVFLSLPDASPHLRSDPRYSIRLANVGTWDSDTGLNRLSLTVSVN